MIRVNRVILISLGELSFRIYLCLQSGTQIKQILCTVKKCSIGRHK